MDGQNRSAGPPCRCPAYWIITDLTLGSCWQHQGLGHEYFQPIVWNGNFLTVRKPAKSYCYGKSDFFFLVSRSRVCQNHNLQMFFLDSCPPWFNHCRVLTYIKKIMHSMLCVNHVYLRASLHFPCIGQKVNQRSLNSHYHHKAAAIDNLWLSFCIAIWSSGMQTICVVWQFLGIWMPLLFCHATSVGSTFDQ